MSSLVFFFAGFIVGAAFCFYILQRFQFKIEKKEGS